MTDPSTDEHDHTTGSAHFGRGPVESFWDLARFHAKLNTAPSYFGPTTLEMLPPPAWSFGATPEEADALLALVLDGTKTATSSALWDYEAENEPLPEVGTMGIVVDGAGNPRALVETTDVSVVPFDEVDAEHAHLEGEGDRSLAHWRAEHERFFTAHPAHDRGFEPTMPLVLERFRVVYAGD
ncbi:ASCH domain protein [Nocardioides dokdonensis FR1436]|uniref:ASCH domain protein n=1 Tax=Nocardioides dokdonensis FR1436 TaxID=1300347 RepID=A0A1A9GQU3_9ACTN|nr:ASCH domain-containing protein [Nocardioides dokdonensis]ANH39815.1 ASCH domain protein [Nocardioides dokdonensis FR1436]